MQNRYAVNLLSIDTPEHFHEGYSRYRPVREEVFSVRQVHESHSTQPMTESNQREPWGRPGRGFGVRKGTDTVGIPCFEPGLCSVFRVKLPEYPGRMCPGYAVLQADCSQESTGIMPRLFRSGTTGRSSTEIHR